MIIQIGNIYYYISLVLMIVLTVGLYYLLKNKSDNVKKYTLLSLAIFNFLLHFLKLLHPTYNSNMKFGLIHISLENICAVSTVLLPFAMIMKNKLLKGYFYFVSFLGGLMAVIITTNPVGLYIFEFESIRYYTCHYILFMVPIVACLTKEYKPEIKHAIWMPFMFLLGQTIILLNEILIWKTGLLEHTLSTFLSSEYRNPAFVFGPNDSGKALSDKLLIFVPEFMKTNIFGIDGVGDFYWPVLWLLVPSVLFFPIGYIILTLPFTYKDFKFKKQ